MRPGNPACREARDEEAMGKEEKGKGEERKEHEQKGGGGRKPGLGMRGLPQ